MRAPPPLPPGRSGGAGAYYLDRPGLIDYAYAQVDKWLPGRERWPAPDFAAGFL